MELFPALPSFTAKTSTPMIAPQTSGLGSVLKKTFAGPIERVSSIGQSIQQRSFQPLLQSLNTQAQQMTTPVQMGRASVPKFIAENAGNFAGTAPMKAAAQTASRAATPAIDKLLSALKESQPIRKGAEKMYAAERTRRAGAGAGALQNMAGERGFYAALGKLKGELPKPQFTGVRATDTNPQGLIQADVDELFDTIRNAKLDFYTQINAMSGLSKILGESGGRIPTTGELKLLQKVFGKDLPQAVLTKRSLTDKLLQGTADVLNVPRSIMSSFDMSAPLRQGLVLTVSKPKQSAPAFAQMFRYFTDPKYFKESMEALEMKPSYPLARQSGLALSDTADTAIGLTTREEAFMSNLAEKIPGVGRVIGASERAYTGFLNKLRADVFEDISNQYIKAGISPAERPEVYGALADFVNTATGRGNLGPLNKAAPVLNGVFFSPRLMASRFQFFNPVWYAKMPPEVRKEAAKDVVQLVGTGIGILSLAKLGGAQVEADPRSSDFGKIRMGNIRWDIWGGFQQWARLIAQLSTGETKSSTSGRVYKLDEKEFPNESRLDRTLDFFISKFAPVPGLVADLARGENMVGESLEYGASMDNVFIQRLLPLYFQDVKEAVNVGGVLGGAAVGVPAFFGVGSNAYEPKQSGSGGGLPGAPSLPELPKLPKLPSL